MNVIKILCLEVWVKFRDNSNGQRLAHTDGPPGSKKLMVIDDGVRLVTSYQNEDGVALKIVTWPYQTIKEYYCESVVNPLIPIQPDPPVLNKT